MNTLLPTSSSLVERLAQSAKSLRSYRSLEYDPTTTVISIVTEKLVPHRMFDLANEVDFKLKKKPKKSARKAADRTRIEMLRRISSQ